MAYKVMLRIPKVFLGAYIFTYKKDLTFERKMFPRRLNKRHCVFFLGEFRKVVRCIMISSGLSTYISIIHNKLEKILITILEWTSALYCVSAFKIMSYTTIRLGYKIIILQL